jgi:hypothetical protein
VTPDGVPTTLATSPYIEQLDASQIGKRAWSYAGVLQDAGLSCFEYVEQLTLLLFLKMTDQLTNPPCDRSPLVPPELDWKTLLPPQATGQSAAEESCCCTIAAVST